MSDDEDRDNTSDDEDEEDDHERKHDRTRDIAPVAKTDELSEGVAPRRPLAFIERAQDVLTVRRVYGEPIERNGVTVIPAATVGGGGGGGGGGGQDRAGQRGTGYGGGFGVSAKPAGAFIVRPDGSVTWRPAIDVNRTIFMGQLVAIVFLLTIRSVVKAIAKRR